MEGATRRLLYQQVKIPGQFQYHVSLQLFPVVWIFQKSLGIICYHKWVLSEGHKKNFKDWCLVNLQPTFLFFNLFLTQWIMDILSKGCKPHNFESHNSLKLTLPNILNISLFQFCWMQIFQWIKLSWHSEKNLDDSIDSGNFSASGYLPFIWKDSITHIHGLPVYVKEGLPFA